MRERSYAQQARRELWDRKARQERKTGVPQGAVFAWSAVGALFACAGMFGAWMVFTNPAIGSFILGASSVMVAIAAIVLMDAEKEKQ